MREIKFIGSFNVGDEVELEVYAEECCELCGETTNVKRLCVSAVIELLTLKF